MIASPDSEPSSPSGTSRATPVRQLAPVLRRWPRSSGRRRWHGHHDAPHSLSTRPLSSFSSLALSLAETPSLLPPRAWQALRALASASCLASERLHVRLMLLHLLHPSVGRDLPEVSDICEFRVVGFTAVVTPIPANLAAAPSLLPFFLLSRVKVGLGLGVGPRHAIAAEAPPSRGNTAAAPPCSPPTSTSHVSRLTGAVRVRRSYLESSALTH